MYCNWWPIGRQIALSHAVEVHHLERIPATTVSFVVRIVGIAPRRVIR
jgi:hypothetical protein